MSVVLHYFPLRARGEPLRMLLRYTGLPHVDKIVTIDEWFGGEKDKAPPGRSGQRQLPLLGLPSGDLMPESLDIAKYIAERADPPLLGEDPAQAERLFLLQDTVETPFGHGYKNYHRINPILNWFPREEAEAQIPEYLAAAPATWRHLAGELGDRTFFGGVAPHYADFAVFHYLDNLCTLDGGATLAGLGSEGVALRKWYEAMCGLPAVSAYISERPQPGSGLVGKPGSIMATVAVPSELPAVKQALGIS